MIAVFRVVFCVAWSVFWIPASFVLYVITLNSAIPVSMARTCWAPGILWVCGIRLKCRNLEVIGPSQPYVFVSNHQSYLDIPILFRSLPRNIYFVAKKELKNVPFLGWYMVMTGMIFVDRSNRQKSIESLKQAALLISNGKSVLMFPEGTRGSIDHIGPFKKGSFMLAYQAGVPVVPIGIREIGKPFSVNRFGKTDVEIAIGGPVLFSEQPSQEDIIGVQHLVGELAGKPTNAMA